MDKVLFVDDEVNILKSIQRLYRNKIDLTIETSPIKALEYIKKIEYSVIVCDMNMPEMSGLEFFKKSKIISPNSICIILTGNSDSKIAINTINDIDIYKYLNKPCDSQILLKSILEAIQQYQQNKHIKNSIEESLSSIFSLNTNMISMVNPYLYTIISKILRVHQFIMTKYKIPNNYEYNVALNFCFLGLMTTPEEKLKIKIEELSFKDEIYFYEKYYTSSATLLDDIYNLKSVKEILLMIKSGINDLDMHDKTIATPILVLKMCIDYTFFSEKGYAVDKIVRLFKVSGKYNNDYVDGLTFFNDKVCSEITTTQAKSIKIKELKESMILGTNVVSEDGLLLVPKATILNTHIISFIKSFINENSSVSVKCQCVE